MVTHEATALNESFNKGRKSGKIEVHDNEVIFFDEGQQILSMPIQGMKISHGGTGNRYVYMTHPDYPEWTISTDDKKVLNYHSIKHDDERRKSVVKIKNNRRLLWLSAYSLLGIVVATVLLFYIFRGAIVEQVVHQIPVTWEQEISGSLLESAIVGKKVIDDKNINLQLSKITDPLVNSVENKDFKFTFTIVEDETLNAFALPGGAIVIHSGLIMKAKHVNEVAGVLAHEICHVTRRHHIRGMVDKLGFFVLLRALIGDASGIGAELALLGTTLESLKYSRDYELEADESGWKLMLDANLDPKGMIDFFEKLHHEHGGMDEATSFMSTHPATSERIKILQKKALSKKDYTPIDVDFEQFKKDIDVYFTVN